MSDAPPDSDADHDHDHAPETNQAIGLGLAHGVGLGILLSPRAESDSIADSQQAPEPTRRFKKEKEKPVLRFAGTSSANPGSAQPARASARQPSHAVAIRPIAAPDFAPISAFDLLHQPDDPEQEPSIAAEEEEEEPKRAPRGRKRTRFANESQNEYFDHDERLRSQSVLGSQDGRMVKGLVGGVGGLGDAPREEDDQDGFDEGVMSLGAQGLFVQLIMFLDSTCCASCMSRNGSVRPRIPRQRGCFRCSPNVKKPRPLTSPNKVIRRLRFPTNISIQANHF